MSNNWYKQYTPYGRAALRPAAGKRPLLRLALGLLCLLFPLLSHAQAGRAVSGRVLDAQSNGLPGVTVLVSGTTIGTSTGADGSFEVQVPETAKTLTLSFVGYATQQVDIAGKSAVQVTMKEDAQGLGEVVVMGYGSVRKNDLTGAVGTVAEKDFNKGTFASPDQLIQGRVSGVQVTNSSGQPGGSATVKIRGSSAITGSGQPLYVVDGVPLDGRSARPGLDSNRGMSPDSNPLNFLNPADIASMEILKDASATAIYGSRAAYGVVLITTKRGKSGQARIDVGLATGVSSIMRRLEVLNASQYRAALTRYGASATNDKGGDTDALGAILQKGLLQNYNVAMSGGTDNGRYRVSLGYLDQNGIVRKTGFKKYSANVATNLNFLDSKKLGIDLNLTASQFREKLAPITNNADFQGSLIGQALQWNPTEPLRNENGSLNITKGGSVINPLAQQELYDDNSRVSTILASVSPYYKFTDWLEYRLLLSANYSSGIRRTSIGQDLNLPNTQGLGFAAIGNNELLTQQITNTLNFNRKVATDLNLNALLGYEYTTFQYAGTNINATGPTGGFGTNGQDYTNFIQYSNPTSRNISSFADPATALQSYFGRAILNYKDRYLLTATARADGSTKFGPNNQYGFFPSFSAAWDISQESFFEVANLNQFKIRAGYGRTGNQEFPAGSAQSQYAYGTNGALNPLNNQNPDLKWQADEQYNVGLDVGLFNNRVAVTVDYFKKTTTGLLFPTVSIQPAAPGGVVTWKNLDGQVVNKGVEAAITTSIVETDRFGLGFNVNATFIRNNVSGLPAPIYTGTLNGQGLTGVLVETIQNGLPINSFNTREFLGIDPATGQASYADNGAFRYVGDPNPKTLLGASLTARYRKLSLIANATGVFGQLIYNNTLNSVVNVGAIGGGKNIALVNFESPIVEAISNPLTASSRFLEKGDYLKLSNVTLSYAVGDLGKVFKGANVYVTGQNLFVITNYTGFDPEINTNKAVNGVPSAGIDYTGYPTARTFTFGVNFSL
jgi:TonB-linked SusC/RagA family outer membrane protein